MISMPGMPSSERPDLITGALGFVGCHLATSLLADGHEVLGVGRHLPGEEIPRTVGPFRFREDTPDGWCVFEGEPGSFRYRALALEEPQPIKDLIAEERPGTVYHLAAQSSAAVSFRDPGDTLRSNLMGTLHLLEAVRALGATGSPKVLSVGSCEEYGALDPEAGPVGETAACHPVSPYGVSKAAQTQLCRQYAASWDLPIVATRSFSHTGPGHDARFAFPSFARQVAAAENGKGPAEIMTGDLSSVRDFLDVRDVIAAYRLLNEKGRPGETYNVCSGNPLTMAGGLEILVGDSGCAITIKKDPERVRPADIPWMVGDHSKLRQDTGWSPSRDIRQTLLELLAEARKEYP